ncbi:hypothetical protein NKH18_34495 [Streptomyces sp. M10(2022)]
MVFLATANVIEAIPEALLDRMELVRLDGYTEDEKVLIARDHLLPRQLERAGLDKEEVSLDESALRKLAGEYTREAGVRNLERAVARLLRKVAAQHELGDRELPFTVTEADLRALIGRPHHVPESAQDPAERRTAVPVWPPGSRSPEPVVTCCSWRLRWPTRRRGVRTDPHRSAR